MKKAIAAYKAVLTLLAAAAIVCLSACQPTPEAPVVAAKNDLVEKVIDANSSENKQQLEQEKQVIIEQIKKVSGHINNKIKPNPSVTINVDADIVSPEYEKIPLVRVRPKNFSKQQFEAFIEYVAGGEPLYYKGDDNADGITKEEITAALTRIRGYLVNKDLPENIRNAWEHYESYLKDCFDEAASRQDEKPYNGELKERENNKTYSSITYLKCYMEKDVAASFSLWQSFEGNTTQITFDNTGCGFGYYNVFEEYEGTDAPRINLTYEQARIMAEDFVRTLDGEDSNMTLYRSRIGYEIESIANYTKETSPQCYAFNYARSYSGVELKPVGFLRGVNVKVDYSKRASPESFYIVIDNDGINTASWLNYTQYIETVSEDTPLMDFETIKGIFEQHCNHKFTWVPRNDAIVGGAPPVTLNVKKIELNLMVIPEKDNLENYITVPVWDFIADMVYDKEAVMQDGYAAEGEKDVSILTVNAIDGSIIDREQGY